MIVREKVRYMMATKVMVMVIEEVIKVEDKIISGMKIDTIRPLTKNKITITNNNIENKLDNKILRMKE